MSGILAVHREWAPGPQAGGADMGGAPEEFYFKTSSPWYSKGSLQKGLTIQQMFDFARFLWKHDPTFQQGIKRVIGYFLTDIEFFDPTRKADLKTEDIAAYRQVLEDRFNLKFTLSQILQTYCIYGNVILSIIPPIERRLICPKCRVIHPITVVTNEDNAEKFKFKYHPKGALFEATCPTCGTRGNWHVYDTTADYRRNVGLNIYNPYNFTIECDQFSDRRLYTWNVPADLKQAVKDGNPLRLQRTPMSILKAIGEDKPYLFNDNVLLHLRDPEIVGFDAGGWGIPQAMYCYGTSRHTFGLRKMNEVLTSDYMIPFRYFSPEHPPKDGAGFIEGGVSDMLDVNAQISRMIAAQRRDPAAIHKIGVPVKYNVAGGEAKELVPGELLLHGEDMQLNAMGIPAQFHRGDLSIQIAPMAARLFEAHWQHIPAAGNAALNWIIKQVTPYLGWKEVGAKLTPPKIADNLDQIMLLLQLMQMGKLSETSLLTKAGYDPAEETRRQGDEAVERAKMEAKTQAELDKIMAGNSILQQTVQQQQAMMAGGTPAEGQPGGMGMSGSAPAADPVGQIMMQIQTFANPAVPKAITEYNEIAQEAAAVFSSLPLREKRAKLREVEQVNKPLADMIRTQMDILNNERNNAYIAQGQAAEQQQGGAM